jgi:ArsR family transcriptional regulator
MAKTKTKKICTCCLGIIGDSTRVKIIKNLKTGTFNASRIAEFFCLSQPTISHHLKALEKIGMIIPKKVGRETFYSLNKKYPCKKCQIFELPFKVK